MQLELNGHYEFEVIEICSNTSGLDYLLVLGPDDKTYKVYNIIKCQYASVPNTIYGIVIGFNINGNAKIRQDECRVLQEHYKLEHYYTFKISDKKKDNKDNVYYVLEDNFSYQRWYSNDDYEIGDDIILYANSISNIGYINYVKHHTATLTDNPVSTTQTSNVSPNVNGPIFDGGNESETVEYKTSIVFTPKNEADIDVQMFNIVREIASFMNANGGTLYIGIHDKTKQIVGIEKDLPHLCEGEAAYADSYTADYDHYELKIRDTVVSFCSAMAGSLIKISFPSQDNITYCKIDVSPAKRPVWTKGNMLFQRQGNQTQMLRGEALTQFVGERIGSYIVAMAGDNALQNISSEQMSAMLHSAVKTAINDRRLDVAAPIVQTNREPKYWIVWYNDGTWSKVRKEQSGNNIFKQIPITEDAADVVVTFCHKSGTVNTVKLSDFKRRINLCEINRNGYNPNETPAEIFVCHPSNLIAVHSADQGGTEYIKMHYLTDFNPTSSGRNQGSYIIPRGKGHVLKYKLVSPDKALALKALIFSKRETSKSFGLDWNNINIQAEISALNQL